MKKLIFLLATASAAVFAQSEQLPQPLPDPADTPYNVQQLFSKYKSRIYQIRVINEATGQKTSIGSGFVVGDGTMLATNYHVISDAVQKENHRLEYADADDHSGGLELLDVDVIHDLAIVRAKKNLGEAFELTNIPEQGAPLFALGNPHDLGFVIIDGINNGLLKKSAQARILFSGSLNSGMSGGPTLDQYGKIVGVNVSYLTRGSNISFVVPAEYLKPLIAKAQTPDRDINASIAAQLFADNNSYYKESLSKQWPSAKMGEFTIPLAMSGDVRCWDSSPNSDIDDVIGAESVSCFNDRETFINDHVTIGQFGYSYTHYYARDPILTSRFYALYGQAYNMNFSKRPMRDYGDFSCKAGFTRIAGQPFKTTLCRRSSKHFEQDGQSIDDIRLIAARLGQPQDGFIIEIGLNGVQTELGKAVIAHILEQITWQK